MPDETDPAVLLNKLINDSLSATPTGLKCAPVHWFPRRAVFGILMFGLGMFACGETSAPSDEMTTAGDLDSEDTEDAEDTEDPTGSTTGDGGGSSSGGNPGAGGGSSGGSPGTGGAACQVPGAGGGIYLFNCPEWLGESSWDKEQELAYLADDCSTDEGQGGAAAFKPVLKQLCETVGSVQYEQTLVKCLEPLAEDACDDDHANQVLACLGRERPCDADGYLCPSLTHQCSDLDQDLCYWGMNEARSIGRAEDVVECFLNPQEDESCDEAFLRCAWGLVL